jgi:AraC-like DNA-binding protein
MIKPKIILNKNLRLMPIYMDRHDVSEEVTAENVAQLHSEDLKIQHKFDCKGLTYWFDDERKTAFCLVEAPNERAVIDMHDAAHGEIPHRIVEVDKNVVESFLGRIEDPEKSQNTKLNIINDPAFRCIMAVKLSSRFLDKSSLREVLLVSDRFKEILSEIVKQDNGRLAHQDDEVFLISFTSVENAVKCSMNLQKDYKNIIDSESIHSTDLSIALSAGVPVTSKNGFFDEAIRASKRMSRIDIPMVKISTEIKDLYESQNLNNKIDPSKIYTLSDTEEAFLRDLIDFTENNFTDESLSSSDFYRELGYSKSQFYRKITGLLRKSPNVFLKEFRLSKSISLLKKREVNISEIAYKIGFNSQSYFSKCFQKKYKVSPTLYRSTINS